MEKARRYLNPVARALLSAIFIISGLGKLSAIGPTQGYMVSFSLPSILIYPTIAFEILAGLALLAGWQTRRAAFLLAGFSVVSALIFHTNFAEQSQMIMFLKNLAMAGGLLLLFQTGASAISLDARSAR